MSKSLLFLCLIEATVVLARQYYSNADYNRALSQWCSFGGDKEPCLKNVVAIQENLRTKCFSKEGCSNKDIMNVCCSKPTLSQECINRCYPGKGYILGQTY